MTQAKHMRDKILFMIRDKVGYGIGLIKTCDEYGITVSDFYDFLYDAGYEYYGSPAATTPSATYTYGFATDSYDHSTKPGDLELAPDDRADAVNHPSYYKTGGVEAIDAIHAWELGFDLGNAVKYIARAGKKDPSKYTEDLEKARWYISSEIERYKKEHEKT